MKLIGSGAYYSVSSGLFTNNGLFLQNNHYKNKNYVFVGLGIRSLVFCANTLFIDKKRAIRSFKKNESIFRPFCKESQDHIAILMLGFAPF